MQDRQVSRRSVLAGVGALAAGGCLGAERTPAAGVHDWRMAGRDPGRTGYAPEADPPRREPTVRWDHQFGTTGGLSLVVADGVAYFQTSNELVVCDVTTGEATTVDTHGGFEGTGNALFAAGSTYRDGTYVVPYGDTLAGYATDAEPWPDHFEDTGRSRRRWVAPSEGPTSADRLGGYPGRRSDPPIAVDGTVLFTTGVFGPDRIYALDADTGRTQWVRQFDAVLERASHPGVRTAAADPEAGVVVASMDALRGREGGLVAFDLSDGTYRWQASVGAPGHAVAVSDGAVFGAVEDDESTQVVALSVGDGAKRWRRQVPVVGRTPLAVDDGHCYLAGATPSADDERQVVTALDREDGTVAWTWRGGVAFGSSWNGRGVSPTVAGDVLLVPSQDGIRAFDSADGEHLWTFTRSVETSGGSTTPRTPTTAVVPVGDRLVVGLLLGLYGLGAP